MTGTGLLPAWLTTCTSSRAWTISYFSLCSSGISARISSLLRDTFGGRNPAAGYCSLEMSNPWKVALGSWRNKSRSQILDGVSAELHRQGYSKVIVTQCQCLRLQSRDLGERYQWMGVGYIPCSLSRYSAGD